MLRGDMLNIKSQYTAFLDYFVNKKNILKLNKRMQLTSKIHIKGSPIITHCSNNYSLLYFH